jgi:hypothetical protein
MKPLLRTLLFSVLLFILPGISEAKEWRGIVPMKSTREDVTRILGKSKDANHIRANYDMEEGHIYIVFSSDDAYYDCVKKLPKDIVLLIQFTPKSDLSLSDLKLDFSKFRKFDPSFPKNVGYEAYVDEVEVLIVTTYNGKIDQINYTATKEDQKICPEYYDHPEETVRIVIG